MSQTTNKTTTKQSNQKQKRRFSLDNLSSSKNKSSKRLGRGIGSNNGKTSGRGHKGQRSRSGHKIGFAFEGGQTPFHRRLPKRGFKNFNRQVFHPVPLAKIVELNIVEINAKVLLEAGLINKIDQEYKILGTATLTQPLNITSHRCSRVAEEAIVNGKGTLKLLLK